MLPQAGYGRTSKRPKKENSERWLLTYSDLITLLLAFFVIMYGMSSADAKKFAKFSSAMKKAFNVEVLQGPANASILEQTIGVSPEAASPEEIAAASKELETIFSEMGWVFQEEGLADKVSVGIRAEGVAISLSGNLLFASGRADLRPDAVQLLQAVARVLQKLPNAVRVEGHTDDVPPNGTEFATNWELSGARAVSVVRYFSEIESIDPGRLSAVAYSQFQPVASNESPRARARNRRSEILILSASPGPSTAALPSANMERPVPTPEREEGSAIATR